jgi:purine-binding chemotaxis protein CheW
MITTTKQLCTFTLDDHLFGVDAQSVQEVIRYQEMTQVPLTSRAVCGLINLRGQIVTAIDVRKRLGMPDRPGDRLPMNVVVRGEDGAVSLLVDQIGDVIEVDADLFELPPDTLRGSARSFVQGAYKLESRLLLLLDTEQVVQVSDE